MNIFRPVVTVLPQPPSIADVTTIQQSAVQVAAQVAAFVSNECSSASTMSAKCYPPTSLPPPEPWVPWAVWASALLSYAQNAYAAAATAMTAAEHIAASNSDAWYAAQSAGSSVSAAAPIISGAGLMVTPQGIVWESADGSTGRYPAAASWRLNAHNGTYEIYPNPVFINALARALQYCQGAVSYAQEAIKLATPITQMPTRIGVRGIDNEWGIARYRSNELEEIGVAQPSTTSAPSSSTPMIFAALGGAVLGGLVGYIVKPKGYAGAGIGALAGAAGGGIIGSVVSSSAAAATSAPIQNTLPPGPYKRLPDGAKLQPHETYLMSLVEPGGVDLSTSTPADIAAAEAQVQPTMKAQGATLLGFWVGAAPPGWPTDSNATPANVKSAMFMAATAGPVVGSIPAGSGVNVFATNGLSA